MRPATIRRSAALVVALASSASLAQNALFTTGSVHSIPTATVATGTVHGKVTRDDGLSAIGARIEIRSSNNSVDLTLIADASGTYELVRAAGAAPNPVGLGKNQALTLAADLIWHFS